MTAQFNVKTIKPYNGFKKTVKKPKKKNKKIFFVLLVLVIAAYLLGVNLFSSVTVTIVPETKNTEKEFNIQLSSDNSLVENSTNTFLAEIIESSKAISGKFEATGEKDIGDKAIGQATFFNSTGRSQPLTNQIEIVNSDGIILLLKESMTIPSAKVDDNGNIVPGQITVDIEAKDPGEKGNIEAGRINITALDLERQSKVYGEILNKLSGGNSKITTVVSQEDLDNAHDELFKDVEYEIRDKIEKEAGNDLYVFDRLINYDDTAFSKEVSVDSETEDFEASLNLKAKALVYNNKELRLFLRNKILEELSEDQTISETEFGNLEIEVEKFDIDLGMAELKIKAIFPVAESIDLEDVKQNILGKKEFEARRYILDLPNVRNVKFAFTMSLNTNIPKKANKVKVKLGEVK